MSTVAPPRPRRSSGELPEHAPRRTFRRGDGRNRAIQLALAMLVILSVYAGRIFDIMVIDGSRLAEKGQNQRTRTLPLPADRGTIYDSAGAPLAVTVESRNVTADQNLIKDPAAAAARLAPMLGMDQAEVQTRLTGEDKFVYVAKGLTPERWRQIKKLNIQGIFSEKTTRRTYPSGTLGANVLGYVNAEGIGSGGLEMALESRLRGVDGSRTYEQGARGQAIPSADDVLREPVPGQGVQLSINRDIQYVAQRAIATRVKEAKAASGTVIAMEAKTGRVLAMATYPTFDPNDYRAADPDDMGNRAVSEIYEPGSTGKLLTISAVLEEGKANPKSEIVVPPVLQRAGHTTHDHTWHGTLHLTLNGVVAESSNIGTILFADRIGGDKLYEYQRKFGMGQLSGLDFPGEEAGLLPSPDKWWPTTFQALAYGQSYSVTSLQVAGVYQTIANGGVRLKPRLIDGYVNPDGSFEPAQTEPGVRVVSEKTARTMSKMLENVVTEGTGKVATIPGYRVAGKTGTAERAVNGGYSGFSASFIGFAPADDPEVVVQVVLQDPKNGHYGGVLGGPVFKSVMTYALQELRVPPSGTKSPKIPTTW
ncbi:MAG: penicillin-binding protein 2 [Candidatus Nanopelagicales bacterium]